MNLNQLMAFREVMNTGSISQAANSLNRTQPAVSLAIRGLEEDLGLKLFERQGRQLIPVPEAHYLLSEADEILDRLAVSYTMKSLRDARSGSLNLAAMPGPSFSLFPRYVSKVISENPDIRISLSSRGSPQIRELASTQSIDFGFADYFGEAADAPSYKQYRISGQCFCAVPAQHPLAGKAEISCRDLDNLPMGVLKTQHPIFVKTQEVFQTEQARFNKTIDAQFFVPLLQFVAAGHCFSLVDPLTVVAAQDVYSVRDNVVFRPLAFDMPYTYSILTPAYRPMSQLGQKVLNGWKEEILQLLTELNANPVEH